MVALQSTNIQNYKHHIDNFDCLGKILSNYLNGTKIETDFQKILDDAIEKSSLQNPFFTKDNIHVAFSSIIQNLHSEKLKSWLNSYNYKKKSNQKLNVAVIIPGNIPLVGFHDFLCVLVSGNIFTGKLSHNDKYLLPAIAEILKNIDAYYKNHIFFTEEILKNYHAVIATGSNNTARYFEYYFKHIPHIIRKNRNSIAVLSGNETDEELKKLADDVFLFFGLGCRNISKIFVPLEYNFSKLIKMFEKYSHYIYHNKYKNNYDYYRTIFIINSTPFIDGGFFILHENSSLYSPVSVLNYEFYNSKQQVLNQIHSELDKLQCVAARTDDYPKLVSFGQTQFPQLNNYADDIDTLEFLLKIK